MSMLLTGPNCLNEVCLKTNKSQESGWKNGFHLTYSITWPRLTLAVFAEYQSNRTVSLILLLGGMSEVSYGRKNEQEQFPNPN